MVNSVLISIPFGGLTLKVHPVGGIFTLNGRLTLAGIIKVGSNTVIFKVNEFPLIASNSAK